VALKRCVEGPWAAMSGSQGSGALLTLLDTRYVYPFDWSRSAGPVRKFCSGGCGGAHAGRARAQGGGWVGGWALGGGVKEESAGGALGGGGGRMRARARMPVRSRPRLAEGCVRQGGAAARSVRCPPAAAAPVAPRPICASLPRRLLQAQPVLRPWQVQGAAARCLHRGWPARRWTGLAAGARTGQAC
jgi:hypothetical protein